VDTQCDRSRPTVPVTRGFSEVDMPADKRSLPPATSFRRAMVLTAVLTYVACRPDIVRTVLP
jgi:hypothetical protein